MIQTFLVGAKSTLYHGQYYYYFLFKATEAIIYFFNSFAFYYCVIAKLCDCKPQYELENNMSSAGGFLKRHSRLS